VFALLLRLTSTLDLVARYQLRPTRHFEVQQAMTAEEQVNSIVAKMEARTMSYEDKVAKAIVKQITAREKELYEQMKDMCDQIDDNLKKMRRILPITKTRFKWDASAQKQVKLLNERKPA
jgi:Mg2+ and Co2+ transporter CorA